MKCELENQNVPEYLKEMEKICNKSMSIKELMTGIIGYCISIVLGEVVIRILCRIKGWQWYYTSGHILLIGAGLVFGILFWFIGRGMAEKKRRQILAFAAKESRVEEVPKEHLEIKWKETEDAESERQKRWLKKRNFGQLWKEMYNFVCIQSFPHTIETRVGFMIAMFGIILYYIGGTGFVFVQIGMVVVLLIAYPVVLTFFFTCVRVVKEKWGRGSRKIPIIAEKQMDENKAKEEMKQLRVVRYADEALKILEGEKVVVYIPKTALEDADWNLFCSIFQEYAGSYEYRRKIVGRDKAPFIRFLIVVLISFGVFTWISGHTIETYPRNIEKELAEFLGGDLSKGTTDYPEIETEEDAMAYPESGAQYEYNEENGGVMPDGTIVEYIPNLYELHLGVNGFQMNDCYVSSVTSEYSHFYISGSEGILMGASANTKGELGQGDTEERLTAKGYYREVEIAEGIIHVSLGNEFVAYIDKNKTLWVSGEVPGIGLKVHKTVLMENVEYVSCFGNSMIILKSDGTVWAVGTLGNNRHIEYSELTQVMEHGRYVAAGANIFAVIQEDGSLWMWGDNSSQMCGIDTMTVDFVEKPYKVMEDVRMVWIGEMKRNSHDDMPCPQNDPEDAVWHGQRTYIQKNDHTMLVCGYGIKENVFAAFEPREK